MKELCRNKMKAVAVFDKRSVQGIILFTQVGTDVRVDISMTKVPYGNHGLHIHKSGDLREGCKSLCDHWMDTRDLGPVRSHGGPPPLWHETEDHSGPRHTGDLGNVNQTTKKRISYRLKNVLVQDVLGRSVVLHADADDYGLGHFDDSLSTGHSGSRIACAIIGRVECA